MKLLSTVLASALVLTSLAACGDARTSYNDTPYYKRTAGEGPVVRYTDKDGVAEACYKKSYVRRLENQLESCREGRSRSNRAVNSSMMK